MGVISFSVKDHHKFKADASLGHAALGCEMLPAGAKYDQWIKLQEGKGDIHVIARFDPMSTMPKQVFLRLPSFRIVIHRETYYPGEPLRGCVVYNVKRAREITSVRVNLCGVSAVHWAEKRGAGSAASTINYDVKKQYFNEFAILHGKGRNSTEKITLDPGTFQSRLECVLCN